MEEVSGGAAVPCVVPQAVSPEPAWRKGEGFSWGDVRCWGEVASRGGEEGPIPWCGAGVSCHMQVGRKGFKGHLLEGSLQRA